jgi:hypothetical protein
VFASHLHSHSVVLIFSIKKFKTGLHRTTHTGFVRALLFSTNNTGAPGAALCGEHLRRDRARDGAEQQHAVTRAAHVVAQGRARLVCACGGHQQDRVGRLATCGARGRSTLAPPAAVSRSACRVCVLPGFASTPVVPLAAAPNFSIVNGHARPHARQDHGPNGA